MLLKCCWDRDRVGEFVKALVTSLVNEFDIDAGVIETHKLKACVFVLARNKEIIMEEAFKLLERYQKALGECTHNAECETALVVGC